MAHKYISDAIEAVGSFDELLLSKGSISIDDFLDKCSPEIKEEIRPLLELQMLLKDQSKKGAKDYLASLLYAETKENNEIKLFPDRYIFPYPTSSSPLDLEERSIIDEKTAPDSFMESRAIIDDKKVQIKKKVGIISKMKAFISNLLR